jgi:predicted DNA-binding transcriptional regulator YafY
MLLRSRTQAEKRWRLEELAEAVHVEPRTIQRDLAWLRAYGHLPLEW